jgi:ABC-type transporter Mla subunit MlaD
MNTTNLEQTIAEMQHQRAALDTAIDQLQAVLSDLNDGSEQSTIAIGARIPQALPGKKVSISDLGIQVLKEHGQPMHIKEIASKVGERRGRGVTRASMEVSFMQTIKGAKKAGNKPLVRKYGPGIFGLT